LEDRAMTYAVVIHKAEEGGYWAEVPAVPGCCAQGETPNEVMQNIREALAGCLEALAGMGKEVTEDVEVREVAV
jgi:predicted RNase H-like HicB family nuclease